MAEIFNFYVKDNRTIQFPKNNLLEPIMQEDHNVAVWRFRIPKVLNDIDMSGYAWWFVYVNAKGREFSELLTLVDDIDEPDSFCTADYSIDYGISYHPGSFQFSLEAINADSGGEVLNEWHTKTYAHKVDKTLQGNHAEFAETESDIISALIVEVQNKVRQLVGGATPDPVQYKAQMTDPQKVYLYIGSEPNEHTGHWYYHNGTTFVSGGVYGAGVTDAVPTQGSTNAVQSGGVYESINEISGDINDLESGLNDLRENLSGLPDIKDSDAEDVDLDISDNNGNVLARFKDGHIQTKHFDSQNIVIKNVKPTNADNDVFDLIDEEGNVILRLEDGEIKTKNFDSSEKTKETALSFLNIFSKKYLYHHMGQEATSPYIPAESLFDIRYAYLLGFDMIEANTQLLTDGVYVVKHGSNSGTIGEGIKDAIGSADYSDVKWSDISSTWLRENVRYNSQVEKYCGCIPTLDEFCIECKKFNMKVKVSSVDAALVARKYLPDEMIWATVRSSDLDRHGFTGTIEYIWSNNASIDNVIRTCKEIGAPLNIVISGYLSDRNIDDVAEMVEKAHQNGFTVGIVYPKPNELLLGAKLGIDCAGSTGKSVNLFENGTAKHITSLSDSSLTLSGAIYDSTNETISMSSGDTIICSDNITIGKGCLILRYDGTLTIRMGSVFDYQSLVEYVSDGNDYVYLANVLAHASNNYDKWFIITANANTTIYELTFDGMYL